MRSIGFSLSLSLSLSLSCSLCLSNNPWLSRQPSFATCQKKWVGDHHFFRYSLMLLWSINWASDCCSWQRVFFFLTLFICSNRMAKTCSFICLVSLHVFLSFVLTQSAPESALVTQVPGFNGTIPSKHYAGYTIL